MKFFVYFAIKILILKDFNSELKEEELTEHHYCLSNCSNDFSKKRIQ